MSKAVKLENPVKFEKITKVYTGGYGCACGCRGKYKYPVAKAKQGSKERGYTVDADETSDRSVKIALGKINKNMDKVDLYVFDSGECCAELKISDTTVNRVYFQR
jgi:hypothetical protein